MSPKKSRTADSDPTAYRPTSFAGAAIPAVSPSPRPRRSRIARSTSSGRTGPWRRCGWGWAFAPTATTSSSRARWAAGAPPWSRRTLDELERGDESPPDLVYVHNFQDTRPAAAAQLARRPGKGFRRGDGGGDRVAGPRPAQALRFRRVPQAPRRHGRGRGEAAEGRAEGVREAGAGARGSPWSRCRWDRSMRPQLVPVVAGNPVDMDQLEALVEQGQFKREDFEKLQRSWSRAAHRDGGAGQEVPQPRSRAAPRNWPSWIANWPGRWSRRSSARSARRSAPRAWIPTSTRSPKICSNTSNSSARAMTRPRSTTASRPGRTTRRRTATVTWST